MVSSEPRSIVGDVASSMSSFRECVLLGDIGATNARFALVTTRMPRTRRRLRRADLQPIELTRTLR